MIPQFGLFSGFYCCYFDKLNDHKSSMTIKNAVAELAEAKIAINRYKKAAP